MDAAFNELAVRRGVATEYRRQVLQEYDAPGGAIVRERIFETVTVNGDRNNLPFYISRNVDNAAIWVGDQKQNIERNVGEYLQEHPVAAFAVDVVDIGLTVVAPVRSALSWGFEYFKDDVRDWVAGGFEEARWPAAESRKGADGLVFVVSLALGGLTARALTRGVAGVRVHVNSNTVGSNGGNIRITTRAQRVRALLATYPKIVDLRTGAAIPFPAGTLRKIAPDDAILWTKSDRGAFIREWHKQGYPEPPGGWGKYDVHHIVPREYGGTNDFSNLVPVLRTDHQLFNEFWRKFGAP